MLLGSTKSLVGMGNQGIYLSNPFKLDWQLGNICASQCRCSYVLGNAFSGNSLQTSSFEAVSCERRTLNKPGKLVHQLWPLADRLWLSINDPD